MIIHIILNEFLDFNLTAKIVATSANKALGLVMAKCKPIGGVSYDVFKKVFDSLVSPIIEYRKLFIYKCYSTAGLSLFSWCW